MSVRDCEAIRNILLGHMENPNDRKWTIMGQSFGGFCAINYISFFSAGLKEVFLAGGLAPLVDHPDPVYHHLIRMFYRATIRDMFWKFSGMDSHPSEKELDIL